MNVFLIMKRESLSVKTVIIFSLSNILLICLTPNLKFLAKIANKLMRLMNTLSLDYLKLFLSNLSRSYIF